MEEFVKEVRVYLTNLWNSLNRQSVLLHWFQAQASGSSVDLPKKKCFYALRSRGEREGSPDVVTGMLWVFSIDVCVLFDPGATLFFVTPLIARKFDILTDILNEPFMVTTLVGESVVAKRYIEIVL